MAAQSQLIRDFLQGEILFITRFDQIPPVGDPLARRYIEDDAGLPARRMSGSVEIEIAFIEEGQIFAVVQGDGVGLLFRQFDAFIALLVEKGLGLLLFIGKILGYQLGSSGIFRHRDGRVLDTEDAAIAMGIHGFGRILDDGRRSGHGGGPHEPGAA